MLRRVIMVVVLLVLVGAGTWIALHRMRRAPQTLTVDQVLAWRLPYDDLIGKDEQAAIETFGPPDREIPDWLGYRAGNPKTGPRKIDVLIEGGKVSGIKVFAGPNDDLGIEQIVQKAPIFCFSSGTYTDSTQQYFAARSVDGRSTLQFSIGGPSAHLHGVMFTNGDPACDPGRVAPAAH